MIDHIGLAVKDMDRATAFCIGALKPLDLGVIMELTAEETRGDPHSGFGKDDGFGKDNKASFRIGTGNRPKGGAHVAFTARTSAEVDSFHRAALAAGGLDNGARPEAPLPSTPLRRLRPRS